MLGQSPLNDQKSPVTILKQFLNFSERCSRRIRRAPSLPPHERRLSPLLDIAVLEDWRGSLPAKLLLQNAEEGTLREIHRIRFEGLERP